jgi:hypothetical protein
MVCDVDNSCLRGETNLSVANPLLEIYRGAVPERLLCGPG